MLVMDGISQKYLNNIRKDFNKKKFKKMKGH